VKTAVVLVVGVLLLIVAVAGFVITPQHAPDACGQFSFCDISVWSQSTYDAARIGTWAALIVGAVLVLLGLIRAAQRGQSPPPPS
jgi:hypothetical protein